MGFKFGKALMNLSPAGMVYNAYKAGKGDGSPGGLTPLAQLAQGGGFEGSPAMQFLLNQQMKNPAATSVGGYGAGILNFLKDPSLKQFKGMSFMDLAEGPEMEGITKFMDPSFMRDAIFSANAPAVMRSVAQSETGARDALTRGGLRGSGAEAETYLRGGRARAEALGGLASQAEMGAQQMAYNAAVQALEQKKSLTSAELQKIAQQFGMDFDVFMSFMEPVLAAKGGKYAAKPGMQAAQSQAIGQGVGSLAGLAAMAAMMCWVAEELFGAKDERTIYARAWCYKHRNNWFVKLYGKYGRSWAAMLKRYPWAKPLVRPIWSWMAWKGKKEFECEARRRHSFAF